MVDNRVPVLLGMLLFSCVIGFAASESYRLMVESRFRSAEQALVRENASSLESLTLNGKGMGALLLAGSLNPSVRTASLETHVRHARQFNIARPALQVIARRVGASLVFVVNEKGIITSDWNNEGQNPIGVDVSYRPYFIQAMRGLPSVHGGVSSVTGRLVYYVAAPVYLEANGPEVTGAVVGSFEASELGEFVVSDGTRSGLLISPQGVVFAAGRSEWRLNTVGAMTPERLQSIAQSKQFGRYFDDPQQVSALPFDLNEKVVRLDKQRYAVSSALVDWNDPSGKWRLVTISDLAPVYNWREGFVIALLTAWASGLLFWFALRRATDMRRRRSDSEEIARQHQRLQLVLDNAPVAVCILTDDLQPGTEGIVRFVNPLFTNTFNVRVDAPMPSLFVRPDERETLRDWLREEGVVAQHESQVIDNNNQVRDVLINFVRIDFLGEMGTLGWMIDITEQKVAEREMQNAMNAVEAASKIKGEFLANMSHEIRTPMNAILGMSSLALQGELHSVQRNYIEKVHQAATSLLSVINDILDFSKLESAKMVIERAQFDLEDVFDDLSNAISLRAGQKNLELLYDIRAEVPRNLSGDRLRLAQVLINLANNAVKFTERGEVVVGVEATALSGSQLTLHFWVSDTGIGLTEEHKGKLFNSFTQADSSTTRRFGGSGLGLVISKQLVELMGGRIWVDSRFGVGSTFHFEVNIECLTPADAPVVPELQGRRVLLVDDNASARAIVGAMANVTGLYVDEAANGIDGLICVDEAELSDQAYDLILMDWQMPIMDGLQCVELIRQRSHHLGVRVIMMAAPGLEESCQSAIQHQGVSFESVLAKPITPGQLLRAVSNVLSSPRAVASEPASQQEIADNVRVQLAGNRILLVEDNEMNQELAVALLAQAGVAVVVAANGQLALDILAVDQAFGCVLMDCQMPVMDGYTATRNIRANHATQALPVIAMTASAMKGDMEKALAAGMDDYITKPLDVARMFAIISKWIRPVAQPSAASLPESSAEAPASLPSIPGVDVTAGMAVCMNNLELYTRMLGMFVEQAQTFEAQFCAQAEKGDSVAMIRLAHTLKGTAANIGASAVQRAAESLQQACEQDASANSVSGPLQQVVDELALIVRSVQGVEL
ncbi:hypothetical protein GCM10017655_20360 [Pseudomonas turukhanskensis]|uniref:Sensory/regulatory protein RpfC n=2 Tax=Pseudomonas turukhanskensis TaxID=1806536 RepID=A0A9W6NER3_9PSED|nr:hypothetical protein GCM10017655_20360 [Pseudomonas turukhanskensis]